jgi:hypothetical protein
MGKRSEWGEEEMADFAEEFGKAFAREVVEAVNETGDRAE